MGLPVILQVLSLKFSPEGKAEEIAQEFMLPPELRGFVVLEDPFSVRVRLPFPKEIDGFWRAEVTPKSKMAGVEIPPEFVATTA